MKIKLNKKYQNLFKKNDEIRYIVISGGRGNGKSFASALWLVLQFYQSPYNSLYLRQTLTNADVSTIPQFLQQVQVLKLHSYLNVKHGEIGNTTGGKLFFKGFRTSSNDQDANLKSIPNLQNVLIEQATEVTEQQFDKLNLSLRAKFLHPKICLCFNPSHQNHWIYKRFFKMKNIYPEFNGISGDTLYIHGNYLDNVTNLDKTFLNEAENCKQMDPLKYENQFLGKWLKNNYNSLWTKQMIGASHTFSQPPRYFDKVVVSIDPAVTAKQNSDTTAISVCGLAQDVYWVIDCVDGKWTPLEWAETAKMMYERYNADLIVAEANQGGDLVAANIRNVIGDSVQIQLVRASKGKILRAEPIASLYQQHKVIHTKYFQQLEYEMLTYSGDPKEKSPNALDATVWRTYLPF